MSIVVNELLKIYEGQKAINQISFTTNQFGITGFLGPNGAGKSTTMKILTGFLQPDGGSAFVGGYDVVKNAMQTKKMIGYLPESNALYPDMYVKEYLGFVGKLYVVKQINAAVLDCINRVGLTAEAHKKIGQLSKGYKQRVGLAAAIIHNPEVLILDEPTSGLDPNQIVEIRALIKTLGKEKTVLLSTHIMQEVEAVCDRVIIISKGNIVADDALAVLKQNSQSKGVTVAFEEALEMAWLERLPAVDAVEQTAPKTWLLTGANADDMRRQVLQLAAEENLNVVSLQTTGSNLEAIFRSLTT